MYLQIGDYFFTTEIGVLYTDKNKSLLKSFSLNIAKIVTSSMNAPNLVDSTMYLLQMWNEKKSLKNINLEPFINNEYNFVVSLEKIVSNEKFGNIWLPNLGFGEFTLERRYTRIGIVNDDGIKTNYCIYSYSPIQFSTKYIRYTNRYANYIRYDKWFDEIEKARKHSI